MLENRKCQECGNALMGRSDQKFCDYLCRNAFGNKKRNKKESVVISLNRKLRQNWTILKSVNPEGKTTIRKEYLKAQGYDFRYFTNVYKTRSNRLYYFCYDYGVCALDSDTDHVMVVSWQPYMEKYQPPIA